MTGLPPAPYKIGESVIFTGADFPVECIIEGITTYHGEYVYTMRDANGGSIYHGVNDFMVPLDDWIDLNAERSQMGWVR